MAKLDKVAQKLFGVSAGVDEISKFGSLAAGSEAFTTNIAQMMSLSNWEDGWYLAVIGGNAPTIQDMNAICTVFAYQLGYLMQAGVAEWDDETVYYIGSIANVAGTLYVSLTDDNTNNDPTTSPVNWRANTAEPTGAGKDFWGATKPTGYVWASGKTIGDASSNATERANADTLALFTMFWTDYADLILPIYTSGGVLSTRGASAAVDFAAHKAISVPDKRGRVSAGKDNLGGTAASRLTGTTMSPDGQTLGAVGGAQTVTLVSNEMPSHTHTQTAHNHTQDAHTHTQNAHNHDVVIRSGSTPGGNNAFNTDGYAATSLNNDLVQNKTATNQNTTATNQATTAVNQSTGGGAAHLNAQPTIVCNYIIKL